MRKSETSNSNNASTYQAPRYRPNWIAAVICFVLGTWLSAALIDYSPLQSSFATTQVIGTNLAGPWGANSSWIMLYAIGASTWLVPLFLLWLLYVSIRNSRRLAGTRLIAMLVCIAALSGIVAMLESFKPSDYFPQGPGGWLGALIYQGLLRDTLGVFGAGLLLGTLYLFGLLFIFTKDIGAEFERYIAGLQTWWDNRAKRKAERAEAKAAANAAKAKEKAAAKAAAVAAAASKTAPTQAAPQQNLMVPKAAEEPLAKTPVRAIVTPAPLTAPEPKPEPKVAVLKALAKNKADNEAAKLQLNIVKPEETKKARVTVPQSNDANYIFPDLKLLKEQITNTEGNSEEEHRQNAENLLRILGEFGVEVTLGEIHVGPVITRYEVVPAAGVRVEKISGLDKNIALGMRAQSVRILAPIPGKAAVGVEVPNQHPTPVGLREILESEQWANSKAELPIALGKDVSGKPLISDLTKMPHLLIAGATGSGKSVCINSIVASILYSKSPQEVRMIMVDPKVVELKIFNTLPQMLIPVVTEPKKVPAALKWLLGEMEQRYQMFAKVNVRNVLGFNNRKKNAKPDPVEAAAQAMLTGVDPSTDDGIDLPDHLPYIVAIIDELADLMMVAPAEIENSIARLAQLARAAGIHLIIATQRPSVNVITGVIKANLPSRIAFQVASQVDSRTILDGKGADTLIGRGDMLFSPPGSSRLVRAQGAFVADEEIIEIVEFMKRNGPPQYAAAVQQQIDRDANEGEEGSGGDSGDDDLGDDSELFQQALDVLRSTKRASTSMIQRRLRIGYNRAARIMDIMEDKGIVGPENGSSPREIMVDLDTYDSG
ncbi:MAG: DNA translocase FtsK [Cephaloticoccus sp.]|nr:DNA translocase FtsK [Cephaloticoccus sp.]MCF7758952.1 DNA translocase FtsK [Cephaloticoccus sp.]